MNVRHDSLPGAQAAEAMPPGIYNVYIYEVFNTASNSVVLASPMLLFFQHLNASATILAVVASLSPFLNILQIPAAHYVERVGYRSFVWNGWALCSMAVIGMTGVAFLPDYFGSTTVIATMIGLVFLYNAFRGISLCGLWPWFSHLVPESRRGEFLANDQLAGAVASIACLFISGFVLTLRDSSHAFGLVFTLSAAASLASLYFLRRIPDVPVEKIAPDSRGISWSKMLAYPPFRKYVVYNLVTNMALGASGVFIIRYFRTVLHITDAGVLFIACLFTLVLSVGLLVVGPLIDRAGNKSALLFSGLFFLANFVLWGGVAGQVIPFNGLVLGLHIISIGLASALWNLSNLRAIMGIVPLTGRPHFLAFYNVMSNLVVAMVPLFWGPVLDGLDRWQTTWGYWHWNSFSVFYVTLCLVMGASLVLLRSIVEPPLMSWDVFVVELFVKTPGAAISRLLGRIRGPVR